MFKLQSNQINPNELSENFCSQEAGAFVSFEGRVRNVNNGKDVVALEYEAYDSLCSDEAQKIINEASKKFDIIQCQVVHRVGKLGIEDLAVWIGVLTQHRDAAFKACRYLIDEVKHRLPIWKKEYYVDGNSGWVNCECTLSHSAVESQLSESSYREYYSRQINLPEIGIEGQKALNDAKVLVIGAGGLGSAALISLASAGIGTIGIVEFDQLEESNLHRQALYAHKDIGKQKVDLASERLKELNPHILINKYGVKLTAANIEEIVRGYDVLVDCTDNFPAKFLLNDAAVLLNKVLIQSSIYQYEGQIRTYISQKSPCLRCLWPQMPEPDCVGRCAEVGVLGAIVNVFGHWQAMETIKTILHLGINASEMKIFNLLNNKMQTIKIEKNLTCPVCSDHSIILGMDEKNYQWASPLSISLSELDESNLSAYVFIDVREDLEVLMDPVNNIEHIHYSMSKFKQANFSFDENKKYILFCAKGVRSLKLVKKLHKEGISNTFSLMGGRNALENINQQLIRN